MTTINHGDFNPAHYFTQVVVHGITERCNIQPAPNRGFLTDVIISTGVVTEPAEGTTPSDSDFSVSTTAIKPKLFVSIGNASELALDEPGLRQGLEQGLTQALKAALEQEIVDTLLATKVVDSTQTAPASQYVNYSTNAITALEKWVLQGNRLDRAFMVVHAGMITDLFKDAPERFHTSLFNYYGVPMLVTGQQETVDGTVTQVGLVPDKIGFLADLSQVTLVPYQEPTITLSGATNPTKPVVTARLAYGINVQNPDSLFVFDNNAAPSA